jgi:SEL1 protein
VFYHGSLYQAWGGAGAGAEGVGRVGRDFTQSHNYLLRVARLLWPADPADPAKHTTLAPALSDKEASNNALPASRAAGYLARMHLRGEGVPQDYAKARMWAERGAEHGDREAQNVLGVLWRDGLRGSKDAKKAAEFFGVAAVHELYEGLVNLGKASYGACARGCGWNGRR